MDAKEDLAGAAPRLGVDVGAPRANEGGDRPGREGARLTVEITEKELWALRHALAAVARHPEALRVQDERLPLGKAVDLGERLLRVALAAHGGPIKLIAE